MAYLNKILWRCKIYEIRIKKVGGVNEVLWHFPLVHIIIVVLDKLTQCITAWLLLKPLLYYTISYKWLLYLLLWYNI